MEEPNSSLQSLGQAGKSQRVTSKNATNRNCDRVTERHFNERKNAIKTKGHLVTKMFLQTLIFPNATKGGRPFLAE
jgi:hypothetical protein